MKNAFLPGMILVFGFAFCSSGEQEVASSGQQALTSAFQYYVASQEALAIDDYSEAGAALEKLASESTGDLKRLAQEAAQTLDIEGMRLAFIPLSDEVAKADLPGGYVKAFCPMANNSQGANWIQKDGNIMNPYFGTAMQHCGTIVK